MYQLVAGVLDHAPAGLTAAEVLVLVAIAENTRALGEVREISTDTLCRRARVDARGLRHVITRLAKNGITVRVPIGTDRLGKPLYATPGRVPRWCLPALPAPPGCRCETCTAPSQKLTESAAQGGPSSPPTGKTPAHEGGPSRPPREQGGRARPPAGPARPPAGRPSPPAGHESPPYPSHDVAVLDQPQRPTLTYITGVTGATDEEARQLIKTLTKRHRPRSIGAYVRGIPADDLRELLAEHRDAHTPAPASLAPQCGACGPNRLIELSTGGVTRCPTCHPRAHARRTA